MTAAATSRSPASKFGVISFPPRRCFRGDPVHGWPVMRIIGRKVALGAKSARQSRHRLVVITGFGTRCYWGVAGRGVTGVAGAVLPLIGRRRCRTGRRRSGRRASDACSRCVLRWRCRRRHRDPGQIARNRNATKEKRRDEHHQHRSPRTPLARPIIGDNFGHEIPRLSEIRRGRALRGVTRERQWLLRVPLEEGYPGPRAADASLG